MPHTPRSYRDAADNASVQVCSDCGAAVVDTSQHDRWHSTLTAVVHVPVVRADGTISD